MWKSAKVQVLSKHCTNFHTVLHCVWREIWLCRDFPHSLFSSRYHPVTQWISKPMSHCTCISISTGEDRLPLLGLQSKYDSRSLWNPIPTIKWPVGWVLRYYHRDSRSQIHLGAIVPCHNCSTIEKTNCSPVRCVMPTRDNWSQRSVSWLQWLEKVARWLPQGPTKLHRGATRRPDTLRKTWRLSVC